MDRPGRDRAGSVGDIDADALIDLASDDWAWALVHLRTVLGEMDEAALGADGLRLRGLPAGRLAGGPDRDELCRFIVDDDQARRWLIQRLEAAPDIPMSVARAVGLPTLDEGEEPPKTDDTSDDGEGAAAEKLTQLRQRLRTVRAERDEQRRRAEGAEARARRLEQERDQQAVARTKAEHKITELEQTLGAAADERQRAVERERRRAAAQVADLEAQLTKLRRDAERRRDRDRQAEQAPRHASPLQSPSRGPKVVPESSGVVPGRPSRLPDDVDPSTREFAELLLDRGRLVLVDGYNVTLRHRADLALAEQRRWLVQLAGTAAQRRGLRLEIVFDGADGPAQSATGRTPRNVRVRFTPEGITADDEIVLAVEATDEPVVVVTDDVELAGRVRAADADVLGADPFVWAVR